MWSRIGIIGVGGIARAIVDGLCGGVEEPPQIFLSLPAGPARTHSRQVVRIS